MNIIEAMQIWHYWLRFKMLGADSDAGSVAEKVVLTALFVALAIVAGTIIYNAVKAKATSISYNTPGY
jgi:hypothetical protein